MNYEVYTYMQTNGDEEANGSARLSAYDGVLGEIPIVQLISFQ